MTPREKAQRAKQALAYYYRNRSAVLEKQKRQKKERYATDSEYRARIQAQSLARARRLMATDPGYRVQQIERLTTLRTAYGDRPPSPASLARRLAKHRIFSRRRGVELREQILSAYGRLCACCGEKEPRFLTLDHINRDGAHHRRLIGGGRGGWRIYADVVKQGCPRDRFRLLCMNCNFATRTGQPCPHQEAVAANA